MTKQKQIETIAKEVLRIDILEARNRDQLDFYDCHVKSIKAALEAAYEAGKMDNWRRMCQSQQMR